MASRPRDGVVDADHRVFGVPNPTLIARIARPLPVLRQVRYLADQHPAISIGSRQLIAGMSLLSMTAAAGLL